MTKNIEQDYCHFEFDFELVLKEKHSNKVFSDYAVKSHNAENVEFVDMLEKLKSCATEQEKKQLAQTMYDLYIKEASPKELNIPKSMKEKTLALLNASKYEEAFSDCYSAAFLHLANLFAHFKRSDSFTKFLHGKSKSFLAQIGKHKSDIAMNVLTAADLHRPYWIAQDLFLVQELMQDYDYWKFIFSERKTGSSLMYSHRLFQDNYAMQTFGFMSPLKTSFSISADISLPKLMQIVASSCFIKEFYPMPELKCIDFIDGKESTSVIQGTLNFGQFFSIRHFCELWCFRYVEKSKTYLLIRKTCVHPQFKLPNSNAIVQHNFVVLAIREIVPTLFQLEHVAMCNFGGNLSTTPAQQKKVLFLFKMATAFIVKGFKNTLLNRIKQMNDGSWKPEDDLKLLQTVQQVKL